MNRPARVFAALALAACGGEALAQGIYTCVDARGRRITSDRPIAECIDRQQRELNPSGTVRRNVGPSLTADEREAQEARERKEAEERQRANDERRRNRAMLARYKDQAAHDKERAEALAQVDEVIATANKRMAELAKERVAIDNELEFYKNTPPDKVPLKVRRMVEENQANTAAQKRFINDQEAEKQRVNARFDEELAQLRRLWAQQQAGGAR